jgi:hypothetical protein
MVKGEHKWHRQTAVKAAAGVRKTHKKFEITGIVYLEVTR